MSRPPQRRLSTLERRRRQARLVAVVVAAAVVAALVLPALALAADAAPREADPPAAAVEALGPEAGRVHTVLLWTTTFLRGQEGPPTEPADQWVAAVGSGPDATVDTVWRDPGADGAITWAQTAHDPGAAEALEALPEDARLVNDEGEWLVLVDGQVRSLVADDLSSTPEPVDLADFQERRAERYARDLAVVDADDRVGGGTTGGSEAGPDARSGPPAALLVGGLVVLVALAAVLVLRRRGQAARGSSSPV